MSRVVQQICNLLENGRNLVLATILSHEGSTPRTAGTKMIVRADGDTIATVGGGLVEAEVIKAAAEVFSTRTAVIKTFDLSGANVEGMDLVCGGRLEILVEFLEADPETLTVFKGMAEALKEGKRCYLAADLGSVGESRARVDRWLLREDGTTLGDKRLSQELMATIARWSGKERYPVLLTIQGRNYVVEPSFVPGTIYLLGAGHISQQVCPLARLVDFRTVVIDDRADFANRGRFPDADDVKVIPSFEDSFADLDIGEDSYVVIVTRGHLHDKTCLEQALKTDAKYIGMIGSRHKRDRIYRDLKIQGFSEKDFQRVHSPIGTDIKAETPEEIGISIIGELIRARAERKQ